MLQFMSSARIAYLGWSGADALSKIYVLKTHGYKPLGLSAFLGLGHTLATANAACYLCDRPPLDHRVKYLGYALNCTPAQELVTTTIRVTYVVATAIFYFRGTYINRAAIQCITAIAILHYAGGIPKPVLRFARRYCFILINMPSILACKTTLGKVATFAYTVAFNQTFNYIQDYDPLSDTVASGQVDWKNFRTNCPNDVADEMKEYTQCLASFPDTKKAVDHALGLDNHPHAYYYRSFENKALILFFQKIVFSPSYFPHDSPVLKK